MKIAYALFAFLALLLPQQLRAQCSVSATSDTSQTICEHTPITQINFYSNDFDIASASGLPTGLTFSFRKAESSGLGIITGTPNFPGTYHYTVSFSSPACFKQLTGTIKIVTSVDIEIIGDSIQTICNGAGQTQEITFSGPEGAFYKWENSNTAIGLPARGTAKIPSIFVQNNTDDLIETKIAVTPSLPTQKSAYFSYTGTLQNWTIPANTISIKVTAMGGRGGDVSLPGPLNTVYFQAGGYGALTSASFNVGPNEKLHTGDNLQILVGGAGANASNTPFSTGGGGGGGGTFIAKGIGFGFFETGLLIAAGGGGGGSFNSNYGGEDGEPGGLTLKNNFAFGSRGLNLGNLADGAGGAGVSENGSDQGSPCRSTGGFAIKNGGLGGTADCFWGGGAGGYGGGGGGGLTGGGGGGFSGGNSNSILTAAGGGSSYIDSNKTDSLNIPGFNSINGFVHIEYLIQTCTGIDRIIRIIVPPVARMKPVADQIRCSGTTSNPIGFSATAKGNSVVFKWTRLGPNIGIPASGRGQSFQFPLTNNTRNQLIDTIVVTPGFIAGSDTCDGVSDTFTIAVNPVVEIDPLAPQFLCSNELSTPILLSSKTTDGVIDYAWTRAGSGLPINGSGTVEPFSLVNSKQSIDTIIISVTPRYVNNTGGPSCVGKIAKDTIWSLPSVRLTPVSDQVKCNGATTDSIKLSSAAAGSGWDILFEWKNDNSSIGLTGNPVKSPVIPSFTATNSSNQTIEGLIKITPTFSYKGKECPGEIFYSAIFVHPDVRVNAVPDTAFCNGQTVDPIYFSSSTPGLVTAIDFKWKSFHSTINSLDSGYFVIPSFITRNNSNAAIQDSIVVTPTLFNLGIVCVGIPDTFKVMVNPTAALLVSDRNYCDSQLTGLIAMNSTALGGTRSYTWINSNTSIGLASVGIGDIQSFTAHNNYDSPIVASVYVTLDYSNGGVTCPGLPDTFLIKVNHRVRLNPVTDQTWCDGELTDPIILNSPPQNAGTVDYTWYNADTSIGLGTTGSGLSIPRFTTKNSSDSARISYVAVRPNLYIDTLSCPGTTAPVKMTILPRATLDPKSDLTVCYGLKTSQIAFSSPTKVSAGSSIQYNWTNSDTSNGLQLSGNGNIPSFTAENPADSPLTSRISVWPLFTTSLLTCVGEPDTFQITVTPEPELDLVLSQIKCDGANSDTIRFSGKNIKGGSMHYEWSNSDVSIGLPKTGAGNIDPFQVHNTGKLPITGIITVTPFYTLGSLTCPGEAGSFTITVNPTPHIDSILNFTDSVFCNGETVDSIGFFSSVSGSVFRWASSFGIGFPQNAAGYSIPSFTAINPLNVPVVAHVTLTVIANGCLGPDTSFSITVNPSPPKPDFNVLLIYPSTLHLIACRGTDNFNFNIIAPDSAVSYHWHAQSIGSSASVLFKNPNDPNAIVSFPESGEFLITAIAQTGEGCKDSVSQQVRVNGTEGIWKRRIIQKQPGNLLFYPDNSMDQDYGYQWGYDSLTVDDSVRIYSAAIPIPGQVLQVFTPEKYLLNADNKLDTVRRAFWVLLKKGSCQSRVYYNGRFASGRLAPQQQADRTIRLKVLPNPNNGRFDLSLEGNIYGDIDVTVYNPLGQSVYKARFSKTSPVLMQQLDIGDLPNGLYYIDLNSSDLKNAETRFMIQR